MYVDTDKFGDLVRQIRRVFVQKQASNTDLRYMDMPIGADIKPREGIVEARALSSRLKRRKPHLTRRLLGYRPSCMGKLIRKKDYRRSLLQPASESEVG